ncbi:unnamed protein product, partial [Meganyctiphanes norvegica]
SCALHRELDRRICNEERIMKTEAYSFSNDNVEYPSGLCSILKEIRLSREFFVGICSFCNTIKDNDHHLHWCSGCQLVAYCSKECQKKDLDFHKHLCKQYLLKNGKNIFSEW